MYVGGDSHHVCKCTCILALWLSRVAPSLVTFHVFTPVKDVETARSKFAACKRIFLRIHVCVCACLAESRSAYKTWYNILNGKDWAIVHLRGPLEKLHGSGRWSYCRANDCFGDTHFSGGRISECFWTAQIMLTFSLPPAFESGPRVAGSSTGTCRDFWWCGNFKLPEPVPVQMVSPCFKQQSPPGLFHF